MSRNEAFMYHISMAVHQLECAFEECSESVAAEHRVPQEISFHVGEAVRNLEKICEKYK